MPDAFGRWIPPWLTNRGAQYQQSPSADTLELQDPGSVRGEDLDLKNAPYRSHPVSIDTKVYVPRRSWLDRQLGPRFAGWRFGVLNFATWASIVFLINIIVTIWGSHATKEKGVILEGDCTRVKRLNTALHVVINILSTILLAGSNYCMQALSAPTRGEVDKVHTSRRGRWLDIGVPGLRNLRYISRQRLTLWCLLGASSLPLHLFYNSAVFATINSNDYFVYPVSQSYLDNPNPTHAVYPMWRSQIGPQESVLQSMWTKARAGLLDTLTPAECLDEYSKIINSNRRNVLLVAADHSFPPSASNLAVNDTTAYWVDEFSADNAQSTESSADIYRWICSSLLGTVLNTEYCSDRVGQVKSMPSQWHVSGQYCQSSNRTYDCTYLDFPVEYCLSERAEQHCKLQFQATIAIVITVLNFLKAALMFYTAFAIVEDPLMTMGDAVASFLRQPDATTTGMSTYASRDFKQSKNATPLPTQWHDKQFHWRDVTSKTRRSIVVALFLIALIVVISLLSWGLRSLPSGFKIASIGYGAADPRTAIVGMPNDLLINAVVANSPQLILSLLYFSYNALFTAMLMGYEWTSYSWKRKGLRVSHLPDGAQRSTYFIQLPYRFGSPLMILSGTLHWLVSQSIFLLAIDYYDVWGDPGSTSVAFGSRPTYKTLGFSPIAIVSVIVLGGVMVVALVAVGFVPYRKGMPLAGSCSLAISAACHVSERENMGVETAESKVQWGIVSVDADGVGHCAFSAEEVRPLINGEWYS